IRVDLLNVALSRVAKGGKNPEFDARAQTTRPKSVEDRVAELQRLFGKAAASELLTKFITDFTRNSTDMRRLNKSSDRDGFARAAHSLAGSCTIFGMHDM